MELALEKLKKFLEFQIKTYQKPNYIEIEFRRARKNDRKVDRKLTESKYLSLISDRL